MVDPREFHRGLMQEHAVMVVKDVLSYHGLYDVEAKTVQLHAGELERMWCDAHRELGAVMATMLTEMQRCETRMRSRTYGMGEDDDPMKDVPIIVGDPRGPLIHTENHPGRPPVFVYGDVPGHQKDLKDKEDSERDPA